MKPELDEGTKAMMEAYLGDGPPAQQEAVSEDGTPSLTKGKLDPITESAVFSILGGTPPEEKKEIKKTMTESTIITWLTSKINAALVANGVPEEKWAQIEDAVLSAALAGKLGTGGVSDETGAAIGNMVQELIGVSVAPTPGPASPLTPSDEVIEPADVGAPDSGPALEVPSEEEPDGEAEPLSYYDKDQQPDAGSEEDILAQLDDMSDEEDPDGVAVLDPEKGKAAKTGTTEDDVDPEQLKKGIKIEKEHTDDPDTAKEIALDHLAEDPEYYTKLEKMEKGAKKEAVEEPGPFSPKADYSIGMKMAQVEQWIRNEIQRNRSAYLPFTFHNAKVHQLVSRASREFFVDLSFARKAVYNVARAMFGSNRLESKKIHEDKAPWVGRARVSHPGGGSRVMELRKGDTISFYHRDGSVGEGYIVSYLPEDPLSVRSVDGDHVVRTVDIISVESPASRKESKGEIPFIRWADKGSKKKVAAAFSPTIHLPPHMLYDSSFVLGETVLANIKGQLMEARIVDTKGDTVDVDVGSGVLYTVRKEQLSSLTVADKHLRSIAEGVDVEKVLDEMVQQEAIDSVNCKIDK